jgi:serine protease
MIKRRFFLFVCSFVLAPFLFSISSLSAQQTSQTPLYVKDEVIVRFQEGVHDYNKALAHSGVAATPMKVFETVQGLELIKLPPNISVKDAVELYLQNPDVLYAEPNYIVEALAVSNDPLFAQLWGLHNTGQAGGTVDADIDAPEAWDITTGSSQVVVAVIDTGIDYNHQDLSANMFQNTADCNNNGLDDDGNGFVDDCFGIDTVNIDSDPMDDNNHGTHVAGIIGAVGNNSIGVIGINWTVKLMACKFLNAGGAGSTAAAIECLNYVALMKDRGVNIIATNNSWGARVPLTQSMFDAIDTHHQRGILFIAAAGNDNRGQ